MKLPVLESRHFQMRAPSCLVRIAETPYAWGASPLNVVVTANKEEKALITGIALSAIRAVGTRSAKARQNQSRQQMNNRQRTKHDDMSRDSMSKDSMKHDDLSNDKL